MKNKLVLSIVCVFFAIGLSAQKKVATYPCKYFGKEYDINASFDDGKSSVYIEVASDSKNAMAMLKFDGTELDQLRKSLGQIKDKFAEWSKIAKENNVTKMSKEIESNLPKATVCWHGSKWFFAFDEKLTPKFRIMDDGSYTVSCIQKVTASSNEYIDETIFLVFSSPSEIEALIKELDIDKMKEKLGGEQKTDELFK